MTNKWSEIKSGIKYNDYSPSLTLREIKRIVSSEDGKTLYKLTFDEKINDGETHTMNFDAYARNRDGEIKGEQHFPFYYFVTILNRKVRIPIYKKTKTDGNYIRWQLLDDKRGISQDVRITAKEEKKKWDKLGYTDRTDLTSDNKSLVDKEVSKRKKKLRERGYHDSAIRKIEDWEKIDKKEFRLPDLNDASRIGVVKAVSVSGNTSGNCYELIVLCKTHNRSPITKSDIGRISKNIRIHYDFEIAQDSKSKSDEIIVAIIKEHVSRGNEWNKDVYILRNHKTSHSSGTSATSAVFLAFYSNIRKIPISSRVAITGVVEPSESPSSQWKIKKIAGVDLKVKAAVNEGATTVIIPESNFSEVNKKYKGKLEQVSKAGELKEFLKNEQLNQQTANIRISN